MLPRQVTSSRPVPSKITLRKGKGMVMLAEHYDFVIGGDPDRDTIDLAILEAGTGPGPRPDA